MILRITHPAERLASMVRINGVVEVIISSPPKPVKAKLIISTLLTVAALDSGRGRLNNVVTD